MVYRKYSAKRDDSEREIVQALRQAGAHVYRLNERDLPDLLVEFRRQWILLEVKGPQGRLTPGQQQFIKNSSAPVYVVRDWEEALRAVGAKKEKGRKERRNIV